MRENINTTPAATNADKTDENTKPSKLVRRLKLTGKWVGMSALAFGLGAAGFLGVKYYTENKQ